MFHYQSESTCLITYNQILVTKYLQLDNFKQTFQVFKYYLMDENGRVFIYNNPDMHSNIVLDPFNLKRPSLITQSIAKTLGPFPNTMFGWRDYREDGKQWVENGVENSVFHCLGSEGKKR